MIHGITVTLHVKTQTGTDAFNQPVYTVERVPVDNVLVGEPTTDDIVNAQNLDGRHLVFNLGIPKGDTHIWTDTVVEFFGQKFRTFGDVVEGIEDMVPTPWHKKVKVERYGENPNTTQS